MSNRSKNSQTKTNLWLGSVSLSAKVESFSQSDVNDPQVPKSNKMFHSKFKLSLRLFTSPNRSEESQSNQKNVEEVADPCPEKEQKVKLQKEGQVKMKYNSNQVETTSIENESERQYNLSKIREFPVLNIGKRSKKQLTLMGKLRQARKEKMLKLEGNTYQQVKKIKQSQKSFQNQNHQENNNFESELTDQVDSNIYTDESSCSSTDSSVSQYSTKSLNLGLQSRIKPSKTLIKQSSILPQAVNNLNISTLELIKRHLKLIQNIYNYIEESMIAHVDIKEWQELHFLLLKKYYLERMKVLHFLQKYPMKNPFSCSDNQISIKDILKFMKTEEGTYFIKQLEKQNKKIRNMLQEYYSKFQKSKVGEKINLFEYDNFSKWIFEELWAEFTLTEYNTTLGKRQLNRRLCKILQLIFLISELNGNSYLSFNEGSHAIQAKKQMRYISEGKQIFKQSFQYQ